MFGRLNFPFLGDGTVANLAKGAGLAFVLRGLGAVAALVLNILIGRLLGLEGAGLYFIALSFVSILAVVARLGVDVALLRLVASQIAKGRPEGARAYFTRGATLVAGAGALLALATALAAPWLADNVFGEPSLRLLLILVAPVIVVYALMMVLAESLKAAGRIRDGVLTSGALYPMCALVLVWPLASAFGPTGAVLAYALGITCAAAFGFTMWSRAMSGIARERSASTADLWSISRKMWVTMLINSALIPWVPLLALGALYSTVETAQFGAAMRLSVVISFFLVAVNSVIGPKFAELEARGEREEMLRIARRFTSLILLAAGPVLAIMLFAPKFVMGLFGSGFEEGGPALAVIVLGQAVNAATGSVAFLLLMTGHEKDVRNAALFSAVVLVAATALLLPPLGLLGAAIANAAGVASANLYRWVFVRKRLGAWVYPA